WRRSRRRISWRWRRFSWLPWRRLSRRRDRPAGLCRPSRAFSRPSFLPAAILRRLLPILLRPALPRDLDTLRPAPHLPLASLAPPPLALASSPLVVTSQGTASVHESGGWARR